VVVVVVVIACYQFGSWWSLLFGGDGWQLLSLHDGGPSHCCMAVLGAEKKQDRDSDRKQEETDSEKEQDQEGIVLVATFAWW